MPHYLLPLFLRDLTTFQELIRQLPAEEALWQVRPGVANPIGTLALHLAGNLQHFVGTIMGKTAYVRNRAQEFGDRQSSREQVIAELERTKQTLELVLPNLGREQLEAQLPVEVMDRNWVNQEFLLHLFGHLNYHLGQANYLSRLLN